MPVNDPFAQPAVTDPFAVVDPFSNGPIHAVAEGARAIGNTAKAAGEYALNSKAANVLKKTGNHVLDFISNFDRPRNALAVGTRDAYEAAQLPVETQADNFPDFQQAIRAGGAVDAFIGGAKKGFAQTDFASTQQLLPDEYRKGNPFTSGVAGFIGDVATDPLTYTTLGIAPAVKGIASLASKIPVENNAILGTFNVHVGELAKAKDIERKYRDLVAAEKDDIVKGTRAYNDRLQSLADDLGIPIEQAKARIVAAAEGGEEAYAKLGIEADALKQKNSAQLLKEQELGIPTTERDGYFPHVLTPEGRTAVGKEEFKDVFRRNNPAHASTKQRKLEGTVAEINAKRMYGTDKFFYDDPVIAQAVRDVRHAQSIGTAKFLKEVSDSLGQDPTKAPGHFVKSKANPDKVFDPHVAKMVDKVHKQITDPEELANFLKVYDGAQNWWKSWGLAPRPDYHARNVVGNMFLNYLGDVKNPMVYKAASEIQFKADKGTLSHRQRMIYEAARKRGVVNHGQFHTDIPEAVTKTIERETSRIKASDVVTPTTDNVLVRGGFAAGKALENNARLAHFIDKVNKGMSYDDAAKSVKKYLFDYDDLSDMERNVFKRVLPFYCVPEYTECLTKRGWMRHSDLIIGEDVMVLDPMSHEMRWEPLLDVATFDFDGELRTFSRRGGEIAFTDEHRWPYEVAQTFVKGKRYGGTRGICPADELNSTHLIPMTGEFVSSDESILSERHAAILGWLVTDGYHRWRGNHIEAIVYQHPRKFLDRILALLGTNRRKQHPGTGVVAVPVSIDDMKIITEHFRSKSDLPSIVTRLSRSAAEAMWQAMFDAEGSTGRGCEQSFTQLDGPVMDAFQILSYMTGRATWITGSRACKSANLRRSKFLKVAEGIGRKQYTGVVWCPRTPTGTWIMRQHGAVMPTGNTWTRKNIPLQIEAMATQPGKINKINIAKNQAHQQNEVPDEEAIPNYIKDAGPIHLGQKDGMNKTATLAGYLPTMDLTKLANPADMGVGMISPFIKEPIEQAFNYDTFRRDKIEKFDGQSNDFLGVKMPVRLAKLARNLILLNSVDRANPGNVFGDANTRSFGMEKERGVGPFAIGTTRETRNDLPGGERTLQFGTGVRLSAIDLEKQQALHDIATKKDLQQLKAYVRSANRRNKSREAEEALIALEAAIKKAEK